MSKLFNDRYSMKRWPATYNTAAKTTTIIAVAS